MATASDAGLALRRHGLPLVSLFNDPVAAGTSRPEGNPPDDLHFAEGNYAQNSALEEPHLERCTATETYPKLVFFTLKKIKGFCTLIKKSSTSEKKLRVSPQITLF